MSHKYLKKRTTAKAKTYISLTILVAAAATMLSLSTQQVQAPQSSAADNRCNGQHLNWDSTVPGQVSMIWLSHMFEKTVNYLFREGKVLTGCAENKLMPGQQPVQQRQGQDNNDRITL